MPFSPVEVVGGIALGEGVGGAVAAVVEPQLQSLKNSQWADHPNIPPDAMALAEGVAHGHLGMEAAAAVAELSGFGAVQFATLVRIARSGPGTAYAFELWRRGKLGETAFRRALKRVGLEDEWIDALVEIKQEILSPQELAVMVQRGVVPDPGYLPVGPPSGRGKVEPMPVADIDTSAEAAGSGYDFQRMAALTRIIGLPASPDLAARMVFRGIIDRVDFDRAIAEGNTRNEWRGPLFEGFREIPTAHTYVENRIRGWIDDAEMYAGTARHGLSKADTDSLVKQFGRPLSTHQVWIGLQRGGAYNGPIDMIDPAFLKALRESNIRPEWYNLAWHGRFTYPSPFVMRSLTQDGTLTAAQAEADLVDMGWRPDRAKQAAAHWAGGAGGTADPYVTKADTQLWTRAHRSYMMGESSTAEVQEAFDDLAIPPEAQTVILGRWLRERSLAVKQLTAAQVKKAYLGAVENPATGAPWTREDALTRLIQMGLTYNDANTLLNE